MSALRNTLLLSAPLLSAGCNGVFWGNLGVLCVTVAIFLGTVFLSRSNSKTPTASRSTPPSTSTRS